MRGIFALVLAAAAAGGAAMLLWDPGAPRAGEAGAPARASADPGERQGAARPVAPAPETAPERAGSQTLRSRVAELLRGGDPAAAAAALLAAEAGVLREVAVRDDTFRVVDALARAAEGDAGTDGVRDRLQARKLLAALYDCDATTPTECGRALECARALHARLFASAVVPDELALRHRVQAGESIWKLARGPWREAGVSVAPGFVLQVNGISDARRIRAGQTLVVPREGVRLLIRKERFELAVLLGGVPYAAFPVGLGANGSTPVGRFRIESKIKDPDWYYGGRRIPFGDPENVIGTRWMGFSGDPKAEGIGIHGTVDESSVGRAVSLGCVRMRKADVEALFEWVAAGTEVEIR